MYQCICIMIWGMVLVSFQCDWHTYYLHISLSSTMQCIEPTEPNNFVLDQVCISALAIMIWGMMLVSGHIHYGTKGGVSIRHVHCNTGCNVVVRTLSLLHSVWCWCQDTSFVVLSVILLSGFITPAAYRLQLLCRGKMMVDNPRY